MSIAAFGFSRKILRVLRVFGKIEKVLETSITTWRQVRFRDSREIETYELFAWKSWKFHFVQPLSFFGLNLQKFSVLIKIQIKIELKAKAIAFAFALQGSVPRTNETVSHSKL